MSNDIRDHFCCGNCSFDFSHVSKDWIVFASHHIYEVCPKCKMKLDVPVELILDKSSVVVKFRVYKRLCG